MTPRQRLSEWYYAPAVHCLLPLPIAARIHHVSLAPFGWLPECGQLGAAGRVLQVHARSRLAPERAAMSLIQSHTGPCVVSGDCLCTSNYLVPAGSCGPNNASSKVYANAEVCHFTFAQPVYLDIHLWDIEADPGGCRWDSLRCSLYLEPWPVLCCRESHPRSRLVLAAAPTAPRLTAKTRCGTGTAPSTATRTIQRATSSSSTAD